MTATVILTAKTTTKSIHINDYDIGIDCENDYDIDNENDHDDDNDNDNNGDNDNTSVNDNDNVTDVGSDREPTTHV